MAFNFSAHSKQQLLTLHPLLREILETVIVHDDFRIDQGGRTPEEQQHLFEIGRSTLQPPKGKHLIQPDGYAYAADLWPYVHGQRVRADDPALLAKFAWFMRSVKEDADPYLDAHATQTGERYRLRFGLDWDGDGEIITDHTFVDAPHVELVREA